MPKRARSTVDLSNVLSSAGATATAESALSRQKASESTQSFAEIPIDAVTANIHNVRQKMRKIDELAESVGKVGVLEPIVVRPIGDDERSSYPPETRYVLVMGERRLLASHKAGRPTIPVVVRSRESAQQEHKLMMLENLHRVDLDPIDEALSYRYHLDEVPSAERMSQRELATEVGKTQAHVSRRLKLLQLHLDLQDLVADGAVGVNVAVNHLSSLDSDDQAEVAARVRSSLETAPEQEWEPAKLRQLAQKVSQERRSGRDDPGPSGPGNSEQSDGSPGAAPSESEESGDAGAADDEPAVDAAAAPTAAGETNPAPAPAAADLSTPVEAAAAEDGRRDVLADWIKAHRRLQRAELEEIVRWQAERIPDDEPASLAREWLGIEGTWAEWQQDLHDNPYADSVLRAVHAYTIAADLVKAQSDPNSSAGRRTVERITEQEGGHRG